MNWQDALIEGRRSSSALPDFLNPSSHARFSPCRTWRYTLHWIWGPDNPLAMFVGLNPSTADEVNDDPTVRRCIRFAKAWGYGGLVMMNAFAFRATDPRVMKAASDPVGPDNDYWLLEMAKIQMQQGAVIVVAWGNHGGYQNRHQTILKLFWFAGVPLHCLGITKTGQPRHPLYVKADTRPRELQYVLV
ncbi:MAG: DUF1643 domain-containing protein [Syntrophales bacterium]|nr:DUF1643 domain-containing protein [Syntrophales bacterium]